MQRFLLFGGDTFYPLGGWQDFKGDFSFKDQAVRETAGYNWDWWQIIDTHTGETVDQHPRLK